MPTVLINSQAEDPSNVLYSVAVDDYYGARLAVEHLLQLGHRAIGYLGAGNRPKSNRQRLAGYCDALAAAGVQADAAWVAIAPAEDTRHEGDVEAGQARAPAARRVSASYWRDCDRLLMACCGARGRPAAAQRRRLRRYRDVAVCHPRADDDPAAKMQLGCVRWHDPRFARQPAVRAISFGQRSCRAPAPHHGLWLTPAPTACSIRIILVDADKERSRTWP
jgi:hypothetical protein